MPMLVISDLDGTLLDRNTYAFAAATPALDKLLEQEIPLVLCTSKTRGEVEVVRAALGNRHPFIVENGGAIFIPEGYFPFSIDDAERRDGYDMIPLGDDYSELVRVLAEAAARTGARAVGFSQMTDEDVAMLCGLPLEQAHRARQREFDEAFEIHTAERAPALLSAIANLGKRWTEGGRFFHIMGNSDKAGAVRKTIELFRKASPSIITMGLGDAPNDISFLRETDLPVVIASPHSDAMRAELSEAKVTRSQGPAGWNEAVLEWLSKKR